MFHQGYMENESEEYSDDVKIDTNKDNKFDTSSKASLM